MKLATRVSLKKKEAKVGLETRESMEAFFFVFFLLLQAQATRLVDGRVRGSELKKRALSSCLGFRLQPHTLL